MKYNIIGDIHGRTCWKNLVIPDGVNIFVGDYFSPYNKSYTFEHCKKNFLEILEFKRKRSETVLLVGNHDDEHWHWMNRPLDMTRKNYLEDHKKEVYCLFEMNKDLFQMAYSIENKYLVTHAGVSAIWLYRILLHTQKKMNLRDIPIDFNDLEYPDAQGYSDINTAYVQEELKWKKYIEDTYRGFREYKEKKKLLSYWKGQWYIPFGQTPEGFTNYVSWTWNPDLAAETINDLWKKYPELFMWKINATHNDCWGNSVGQSPVWLRPPQVFEANIFRGNREYHQIIGHTQWWKDIHTESYSDDPRELKEITFVDCLENTVNSLKIETEEK